MVEATAAPFKRRPFVFIASSGFLVTRQGRDGIITIIFEVMVLLILLTIVILLLSSCLQSACHKCKRSNKCDTDPCDEECDDCEDDDCEEGDGDGVSSYKDSGQGQPRQYQPQAQPVRQPPQAVRPGQGQPQPQTFRQPQGPPPNPYQGRPSPGPAQRGDNEPSCVPPPVPCPCDPRPSRPCVQRCGGCQEWPAPPIYGVGGGGRCCDHLKFPSNPILKPPPRPLRPFPQPCPPDPCCNPCASGCRSISFPYPNRGPCGKPCVGSLGRSFPAVGGAGSGGPVNCCEQPARPCCPPGTVTNMAKFTMQDFSYAARKYPHPGGSHCV